MARGQHGAESWRQHPQATGPSELPDAVGLREAVELLACADPQKLLTAAQSLAVQATYPTPSHGPLQAFLYQLRPDGWLQLTHKKSTRDDQISPYRLLAPDAHLPVAQAVREEEAVFAVLDEAEAPPPCPRGSRRGRLSTYAAFPLLLEDTLLGAVIFHLPLQLRAETQRPGSEVYTRLESVATLTAHRLRLLNQRHGHTDTWPGRFRTRGQHGQGATPSGASPKPVRHRGPLGGFPSRLESLVGQTPGQRRSNLDPMVEMALSNAEVGSFDWDFASGRLVWDELLCQICGIDPHTFDGRIETFYRQVHPEDLPLISDALAESYRTGFYAADYRILLPEDGRVRHMRAESRVVFTPQGEPVGMIGIGRDRTEEVRRAKQRTLRRDFVLEVTQAFTAAASTEEIISVMTDTVMPAVPAQKMAIFLASTPHRDVRLIGSYGYTEEQEAKLRRNVAEVSKTGEALAHVKGGEPLFLENREQFLEALPDPLLSPPSHEQSWLVMPLATAEGLLGGCVLTYDKPQIFDADAQILATGIGSILAQSLARTQMFDERRSQLTDLQRMMLPERLPDLPGLDVAAAYHPASESLMVGGDWYDALVMPDGTVSVVIGDVQGHSAQAAAVMGQLRTVMQTHAGEGHRLSGLLERGNRFLHQMDTDLFATCVIVEIDMNSRRAQVARAGHPLPIVVDREGRAREIDAPGGMPLGCFPNDAYPVHDFELDQDDTLLLFTDGLVENTGHQYDEAVDELIERLSYWIADPHRVSGTRQEDLERAAEDLIMPAEVRSKLDDVAVILVRRSPSGTHPRPASPRPAAEASAEPGPYESSSGTASRTGAGTVSEAGWDPIAG